MTKTKILGALMALAVLTVGAGAVPGVRPRKLLPVDERGEPINDPLYGGYSYKKVSTTTEAMVCTGKCVLAGLIMSTGPTASAVQMRDTSTADGGGTVVLPFIRFERESQPGNNPIVLPVISDSGWSIKLTAASTGEEATALYIDLD